MVQSCKLELELAHILFIKACTVHLCVNRNIAQSYNLIKVSVIQNSFCDYSCWICKVYEPCLRSQFLYILYYIKYYRDCTECLEHTSGTICFLSKKAIFKGNSFILYSCIKLSNPKLCSYKICIFNGFPSVQCQINFTVYS